MDDLISRQAAIDALGGNEPVGDPSKMDDDDVVKMWERIRIINIINKLPSAQPDIIRCKECKHYYYADKDFKGEWLLDDYIEQYPDVKVIAWKPLEEPYREGEE